MLKKAFLNKYFVSLLLILSLLSCSKKEEKIPDNVVKPEQMTGLLVDMQLVEATLLHVQQSNQNASRYKKKLIDLVFEKHNISKAKYDSSLTYYTTKNIKALDKIYADVITELSQQQSALNAN